MDSIIIIIIIIIIILDVYDTHTYTVWWLLTAMTQLAAAQRRLLYDSEPRFPLHWTVCTVLNYDTKYFINSIWIM